MRDHGADDLTTRGGLMVAKFISDFKDHYQRERSRPLNVSEAQHFQGTCFEAVVAQGASLADLEHIRALSASDAALARAIDAVPGRG